MNNFFPLIENINSYYSIAVIFILYLLYYFISNSFMILMLIFIGILIGFYIVYIMRDTIPYFYKMIPV
jgi:hypothetical protein